MDVLFSHDDELTELLAEQSTAIDELWRENFAMSKWHDESTKKSHSRINNDCASSPEVPHTDSSDRDIGIQLHPSHASPGSSASVEDTDLRPDGQCATTRNNVRIPSKAETSLSKASGEKSQAPKSRGALMARKNRERKKEHIAQLESKVLELRSKNEQLVSENDSLKSSIDMLSQEVAYLRNVVKNDCELSRVVRAVTAIPGIKVSNFSICKSTDVRQPEENTDIRAAKVAKPKLTGICFNVQDGLVSLELCPECNVSSKKTGGQIQIVVTFRSTRSPIGQ